MSIEETGKDKWQLPDLKMLGNGVVQTLGGAGQTLFGAGIATGSTFSGLGVVPGGLIGGGIATHGAANAFEGLGTMFNSIRTEGNKIDAYKGNFVKGWYQENEQVYNVVDTGINIVGLATGGVEAFNFIKNGGKNIKNVKNIGTLGLKEAKKLANKLGEAWKVVGTKGMHPNIKTYKVVKPTGGSDVFNLESTVQGAIELGSKAIDKVKELGNKAINKAKGIFNKLFK